MNTPAQYPGGPLDATESEVLLVLGTVYATALAIITTAIVWTVKRVARGVRAGRR